MTGRLDLKLGLIGDNIAASRAPLLHRLAGLQNGVHVQYDRLVPRDMGEDFDEVFDKCAARGYRGVNVTYPYKEIAAGKVIIDDPMVRAIGAVNTVLFTDAGPIGYNTDYTGFISAYRGMLGHSKPGFACLIGTGGVGRAIAFGLLALGAFEIRLVDLNTAKAETLAAELRSITDAPQIMVFADPSEAAQGANGLLNGTPVGMVGYDGTPLPRSAIDGATWAFDAVYTPVETQFLQDAQAEGLSILSGYELFIYQGVHAWTHFSGLSLDERQLRTDLLHQATEA